MKTIHIKGYSPEDWLFKFLYREFLKNDSLWHFVYWKDFWTHKAFIQGENLIIRISDEEVLKKVKSYLENQPEISFEEYDFPFPRGKYQLGIKRMSWEARNLDLALPMLHIISEARIKLGRDKRFQGFIGLYFHIAFNVGGYDHAEEAKFLSKMVYLRLDLVERMLRGKNTKWNKK